MYYLRTRSKGGAMLFTVDQEQLLSASIAVQTKSREKVQLTKTKIASIADP